MKLHKHHPANNVISNGWRGEPPIEAPRQPKKGDAYHIGTGPRWIGEDFSISRVNKRSFYVSHDAMTERHLVVEWDQWIDGLFEIGFVYLNGAPVLPPLRLAMQAAMETGEPNRNADIDRLLAEARELVRRGAVGQPELIEGERRFPVARDDWGSVKVVVPAQQGGCLTCSCIRRGDPEKDNLPCIHRLAVMLCTDDLRHRLLEYLL